MLGKVDVTNVELHKTFQFNFLYSGSTHSFSWNEKLPKDNQMTQILWYA